MIELNMAKFNVKNPQSGEYEPLDGASQAKVQSDWNQTDNSAEDFIKNKPNLGTAASKNVDQAPTLSSTNLVESNGVAVALSGKADLENGKIPISQLPPTVIERMVTVADDTARFALTINEVQLGDTVKVVSTNKMYMVIDIGNLDKEAGYQVYVAGRAAEAVADQNGNTINTTYATITDVETALMTKANKTDIVTYIAGSNISIISTGNKVDLFEYTWSNVAPNSTTSWQTIPDSKSLTSAVIDLESVTKFKLQAATKYTHTIFFSGAFIDSSNVLHDFPSSALNQDGTIKQDTEIEVPSGYTGIRLTARLDNQSYQQGSDVHESDFDYIRIEIMEGTHSKAVGDQTNKIINAADQMQSDWNQSDNTSPDYIKNKPDVSALLSHLVFDSSSKTYYLQQTQPANPQDGDIWIG